MAAMGSGFTEVSAVAATGPGRFTATLSSDWTIDGRPNGGYLLALLGRAATVAGPHPDVIAASAHYLRPPEPGPVQLDVALLRTGRSAGQLRAGLSQDGVDRVAALITTAELGSGTAARWTGSLRPPPTAPWGECVRLPAVTPAGRPVPIMAQVDLRLDPADTGFARGRPSGRGELRGRLVVEPGVPADPYALLFAVDALPPATFEVQPTGWVPTLELTAYVRARPAPGPLQVLHRATVIDGGLVDETTAVWDSAGRLVAQATQLAAVRLD